MWTRVWQRRGGIALAMSLLSVCYVTAEEPSAKPPGTNEESSAKLATQPSQQITQAPAKLTVDQARERAILLHKVYAATLEVMHLHYFHSNKSMVPARALEEVFDELEESSQSKANWISVNTKAMSIHHEPKTDFEQAAAAELAKGSEQYEAVADGIYSRAGSISLGAGCVSCHTGFFTKPSQKPRFAGLVIRIPVEGD